MMGDVYVVLRGEYSDRTIVGVMTTLDLAQAFIEELLPRDEMYRRHDFEVERWQLDDRMRAPEDVG